MTESTRSAVPRPSAMALAGSDPSDRRNVSMADALGVLGEAVLKANAERRRERLGVASQRHVVGDQEESAAGANPQFGRGGFRLGEPRQSGQGRPCRPSLCSCASLLAMTRTCGRAAADAAVKVSAIGVST
jgi:hypothetical protein